MFRAALVRSAQGAARSAVRRSTAVVRTSGPSFTTPSARLSPLAAFQPFRCYSAPSGLAKTEVEGRIMDILKNFDKVNDPTKITNVSHFSNDLGLDSLDTVEVVMAIEEEFSIEIPDKEADAIHSIDKAVEYIMAQPDAH